MKSQSIFDENLNLKGSDVNSLIRVMEKFDARTERILIDPQKLVFCSIYRNTLDVLYVAKMDSSTATFSNLIHQIARNDKCDRAAMDMIPVRKQDLYKKGVPKAEINTLLQMGTYFEYEDRIILLSDRFLTFLVKILGLSTFRKGCNPFRELHIASEIYDAKPFYITVRKRGNVLKAFHAASKPQNHPLKNDCMKIISRIQKKGAVVRNWEITQKKTEILFCFPEYFIDGFELGIQFTSSDTGECGFIFCNCLYAAGTAYMIRNCSMTRKNYGNFDICEMIDEFERMSEGTLEEYAFNLRFLKSADKIILFRKFKELGIEGLSGKKLAPRMRESFAEAVNQNSGLCHGFEPVFALPKMAEKLGAREYVIEDIKEKIEKHVAVLISNEG